MAASMAKCEKHSTMLPAMKRVRVEQLCGTPEGRLLGWLGIQCPGDGIQLSLSEAAQVTALGQVLPQQAGGVSVDADEHMVGGVPLEQYRPLKDPALL